MRWLAENSVRLGAIFLVSVGLVAGLASTLVPALRICRQRLAATGDSPVVEICEPVLGEPALIGLFLTLVVLLLLPLLAKFDIAGLFGVELRDVRKTANEARAAANVAAEVAQLARDHADTASRQADEIRSLQGEVQQLQDVLVIRVGLIEQTSQGARESFAEKWRREPTDLGESQVSSHSIGRLVELWSQIEPWAFVNRRGASLGLPSQRAAALGADGEPLSVKQRRALHDWTRLFGFEINFLRTLRDKAIAEPDALSTEELEAAVETAERLLETLSRALARG